jgi:Vacuolar sorting protein 9 (VPS9) domain
MFRTPKEKCRLISQVINIIQLSFKLAYDFGAKEVFAAADDLIPSIVYVLCRAKLQFPFSLERYIEFFGSEDS